MRPKQNSLPSLSRRKENETMYIQRGVGAMQDFAATPPRSRLARVAVPRCARNADPAVWLYLAPNSVLGKAPVVDPVQRIAQRRSSSSSRANCRMQKHSWGTFLELSRHLLPEHMTFRVSLQLCMLWLSVLQSQLKLQLHLNCRQPLASSQMHYARSGSCTTSSDQLLLKLSNNCVSAHFSWNCNTQRQMASHSSGSSCKRCCCQQG